MVGRATPGRVPAGQSRLFARVLRDHAPSGYPRNMRKGMLLVLSVLALMAVACSSSGGDTDVEAEDTEATGDRRHQRRRARARGVRRDRPLPRRPRHPRCGPQDVRDRSHRREAGPEQHRLLRRRGAQAHRAGLDRPHGPQHPSRRRHGPPGRRHPPPPRRVAQRGSQGPHQPEPARAVHGRRRGEDDLQRAGRLRLPARARRPVDHQLHAPQPLARGRADLDHLHPGLRARHRAGGRRHQAGSSPLDGRAERQRLPGVRRAARQRHRRSLHLSRRRRGPLRRRPGAQPPHGHRGHGPHRLQWPPPPRRHPERPLRRAGRRRGRRRGHGPQRRTHRHRPPLLRGGRVLRARRCRLLGRLDPCHERGLPRRAEEGRRARDHRDLRLRDRLLVRVDGDHAVLGLDRRDRRRRPLRHAGRRARPAHPRPPGRERQPRRRAELGGLHRPHRAAVGRCPAGDPDRELRLRPGRHVGRRLRPHGRAG